MAYYYLVLIGSVVYVAAVAGIERSSDRIIASKYDVPLVCQNTSALILIEHSDSGVWYKDKPGLTRQDHG